MSNKFVTREEMVEIIEEIIYSMQHHGTRHNTHDLLVILDKMKAEEEEEEG